MPTSLAPDETPWHDYTLYEAISCALEGERRRFADLLQNTLVNQITLVLAQLNAYEHTATGQPRMEFSVLLILVRQLLQQVYDLEASLNPTILDALGLEPALEALASQQRRTNGVTIQLELARLRERLPAFLELALFRTTQEAVAYLLARGNASHISIQLAHTTSGIRYSIAANGVPLPWESLRAAQQRMAALGGTLTLAESPDGGAEITIGWDVEAPVDLTEREREVIGLLVEGLTNREIAQALGVRPRTIKFHLDNIYSKLGVSTRTEAAIYALRHGWVQHPPPA